MLKKMLSNIMLFLFIIAFVKGFEAIFDSRNTLVGVTLIIAILVLMRENLIKKPFENFLKLLSLNLISGVFAYLSSTNIWLGLILNFVTLAGIGYLLSFNLNKIIIVPFGLQYLFMLYTPVTGLDYTKRIVGLISGAILIMITQFIIHRKNKDIKASESEIIDFGEEYDYYNEIEFLGRKYRIHSIRGKYAIRIGLVAAIASFIVGYFKLEQGRWIVYTIFSLTELYSEHCKVRSKQRLEGTIIGVLIILVLFIIIKDTTIRGLIVLVGGYLDTYTNNYRDKMICVTISVVASVSLTNGTLITAIERIGYVTFGIILALLINRFVLQTKIEETQMA